MVISFGYFFPDVLYFNLVYVFKYFFQMAFVHNNVVIVFKMVT